MEAYLAVIIVNYFSLFNLTQEKLDSFKKQKAKSKQAAVVFIEAHLVCQWSQKICNIDWMEIMLHEEKSRTS